MKKALLLTATAAMICGAASAQNADVPDNLEKLSKFQSTGVTEFQFIEQGGDYAEGIKKTLEKITLPSGFKIELYAVVPDARHMAVGPQGIVTFVGTRKDKVWSVTDRNKDRVADEVKDFAPSLSFTIPNGPCFSPDGFLYIAEQNRVLLFPAAEVFYESARRTVAGATTDAYWIADLHLSTRPLWDHWRLSLLVRNAFEQGRHRRPCSTDPR